MKRTIFLIITTVLVVPFAMKAQSEYSYQVKGDASSMKVELINLYSEITIKGHSLDQIEIEADGYRGLPEKARGLKPLSAFGEDNTEIGLHIEEKGNVIRISGASRATRDTDYTIRLPENIKLEVDSDSWNADDIRVEGMNNEVEIKANSAGLDLRNMTGPLVLNSMNGEIEITFSSLDQGGPTSISATNGDIDITLPGDSKVDFKLSCLNGEIYTDLDMSFGDDEKDRMKRIGGGMKANATIGGGGVEFTIRAINGNIYLRRKIN